MITDNEKCMCCNSTKISQATTTSFFELPVNKCSACSYHFVSYDKNKFDIKKYYSDTYWNVFRNIHRQKNPTGGKVDPVYLINKLPKPIRAIAEMTGVRKSLALSQFIYLKPHLVGKKLLEIGCGEGFLLERFEKNGYDVFGIEPSKDNLSIIKKKLRRGSCITGYVEDSFTLNQKYDVIILSHVIEHLLDCKKVLVELNKLLEPDGIIFIEVPNCENNETLQSSIYTQPHIHHFSKNNLEQLSRNCGFTIIASDTFRSDVITISQHIKYLLKWILKIDHYKKTDEIHGNNLRIILKK